LEFYLRWDLIRVSVKITEAWAYGIAVERVSGRGDGDVGLVWFYAESSFAEGGPDTERYEK
jgi:hypothetical protein